MLTPLCSFEPGWLRPMRLSPFVYLSLLSLDLLCSSVEAYPYQGYGASDHPRSNLKTEPKAPTCRNPEVSIFDYSVKPRTDENALICAVSRNLLFARQTSTDDYSCSETQPCSNGACCSKASGYCTYGPAGCGTNGLSPNDACWSNCDAHAECGQYALTPGQTCPLNVCCSEFGFCGTTSDFCGTGCQSDCAQPGSGASGGDVQSRIIGYYEAWAHDNTCYGMDFNSIPVNAITHLHFAFGYITPGDFNIAPMDGLDISLFSDLTALKSQNSGLKTIVALGGWTFNDNDTVTQPVYSAMVSTVANRATFIGNLLIFLREYAFDGVDFDWEYPSAPDRGGHPDDGINFTEFLKELRDAINQEPVQYVVSFTAPTSYWYLRWFDLSAVQYVDWINVMSYDLHGTWDSTDPIGDHILAHTNLTEINLAFDLFWRNNVPANKLNLGLGFYGRSFQLSDPSCYTPGCLFKGGGAPGSCTQSSGTLSYREIMDVIAMTGVQPYYDQTDAVKYIVWNQDQWVSYDDADTFKQKIDFANNLGLGGLLIWSIDQDTSDLQALQAVLAPKSISAFAKQADDAPYWQNATTPDCYVTDCGGSCNPGYIGITQQPCGNAKPVTRHATGKPSTLCCPIDGAPDPKKCTWRGSASSCNGHCQGGEVTVELNRWGSGDYCESGNKAYCCQTTALTENTCYWTAGLCSGSDTLMTFAGTFASQLVDVINIFPPTLIGVALESALDSFGVTMLKRFCCPQAAAAQWTNCQWYGTPGSCDDNHCALGHEVQLATNAYGLGESCWPRFERDRVFCCDPTGGASPFLPVPLTDLFPDPPPGDPFTEYTLKTDDTWGTGVQQGSDSEPNDAAFAFVVMTSPEALQISLNKRDGASWEVFNCNDAVSEEEQTIQIFCTDISANGTCDRIHLGHGVPGTILEMPPGCGPSRYAVAKSMVPSADQTLPKRLEKRDYGHKPVIYDLTFDFEWKRVPQDLGDTQMRVDYSNEVGYWDTIVDKAGETRRKRSLHDVGGSHKRWLEEEWREDKHFSGLSHEELHARWFGSDVIDWLLAFLSPNISPKFTHNVNTGFIAKLIDQRWGPCEVAGAEVTASLQAQAQANVDIATSFGLTIIAKLAAPLDLRQSYLYFKNKGDVSAIFSIDAVGRAVFSTGDIDIVGLQNFPGATFSIPKLFTIGPNFRLVGNVDAEVTLSGHIESKVQIASWSIQQTYPDVNQDYDPQALTAPDRDGTGNFQGLQTPTFDWSVSASGQITAHLKPTFEFGIIVDPMWQVGNAKVDVVADGWVRFYASAELSSQSDNCPFTYGVDVGADLYASVDASGFGWAPRTFPIAFVDPIAAITGGSCPAREQRRGIDLYGSLRVLERGAMNDASFPTLKNRAVSAGTFGPLLTLPIGCFFCPTVSSSNTPCEDIVGWEPNQLTDGGNIDAKRDLSGIVHELYDPVTRDTVFNGTERDILSSPHLNFFERRATKDQTTCPDAPIDILSPKYDSSGTIINKISGIHTYGYTNPTNCDDYGFGLITTPSKGATSTFATEHILEFQLIKIFIDDKSESLGIIFPDPYPGRVGHYVDLCTYMQPYWYNLPQNMWKTINGATRSPIQWISYQFPGSDNSYTNEFVLLDSGVNTAKEGMWGSSAINADTTMTTYEQQTPERALKNMKDVLSAYKYMQIAEINTFLVNQAVRVANMFDTQEQYLSTLTVPNPTGTGNMTPYVGIPLGDEWRQWIKGRTTLAASKATTYLDEWLQSMQKGYATVYQRQAAANDPTLAALINSIDLLAAAINAKGTWTNPF